MKKNNYDQAKQKTWMESVNEIYLCHDHISNFQSSPLAMTSMHDFQSGLLAFIFSTKMQILCITSLSQGDIYSYIAKLNFVIYYFK